MACRECGNVDAKTLVVSPGTNVTPIGTVDPLVAKIPVVLAEKVIQIDVEADIELEHDFYDIKRIKKDVYLDQCKLVITTEGTNTGKLFLGGYVRKNIEYTTPDCVEEGVVSGGVHHTTVDVPFKCVTEVEYAIPPVFGVRSPADKIELTCNKGCGCEGRTIGALNCEENFIENIVYTEKPFCELEEARIYEADIHHHGLCEEYTNKLIEKMVVYLRIKVLQNQQVSVNPIA